MKFGMDGMPLGTKSNLYYLFSSIFYPNVTDAESPEVWRWWY